MAPYYKVLFPMAPSQVDAVTPSQWASIQGTYEEEVVEAVPWTGDDAPRPKTVGPNRRERRQAGRARHG